MSISITAVVNKVDRNHGILQNMPQLRALYGFIEARIGVRAFTIVRYLISGGTAAGSNFITLFLLVHFGGMYYLYASIIAFIMSIGVSFGMQKFWTFQNKPLHDMHSQFARYLLVIGANLVLNTALVFLFVEKAGIWYLFAQLLATFVIAITGYFGYKYFVFRNHPQELP